MAGYKNEIIDEAITLIFRFLSANFFRNNSVQNKN